MPLVSAWYCPHSKKLFRTKEQYVKNLRKLARKKYLETRTKIIREQRKNKFTEMRALRSFNSISAWIISHSDLFVVGSRVFSSSEEIPVITNFSLTSMLFNKFISNSHNAPIGQPTNFSGKKDLPTGFPGWKGTVKFELSGRYPGFSSRIFENTGICFGSGSGGTKFDESTRKEAGQWYQAEVILFAQDWPGLAEEQILIRLTQN